MNDWAAGYITEIAYTHGYYAELNPVRARLAFLNAGLRFPEIRNGCELAFGHGVSANIHAAGSSARWWGNDFNPAQAAYAEEMAQASGCGAQFTDESFAEFCARDDLPEFDFIGIHGIYSWVTAENQKYMEDFIRRKLRMGGVLYISYNTLPGWNTMAPVQHLLSQHAQVMGAEGQGVLKRLDSALSFVDQLLATQPGFARVSPQIAERYKTLKLQNRHYLAHEYFNRNWEPMYFSEMARRMEGCKLSFGCSAGFADSIDAINLSAEQQQLMKTIDDAVFRETVRDFLSNQQFRRDYWVKGSRRLSTLEQLEQARQQRVVLVNTAEDFKFEVAGFAGKAALNEAIYKPVLDVLSDQKPKTVAQLEQSLASKGVNFQQLWQCLLVMISKGEVLPLQDEKQAAKVQGACDKLNAWIQQRSKSMDEIQCLSSPQTGGGVTIPRIHQMFLSARRQGRKTAAEWADFTWQLLAAQGHRVNKEGQPLATAEQNLAELSTLALDFERKRLPVLKTLGVAN